MFSQPEKQRPTLTIISSFGERADEGQRNIANMLHHEIKVRYDASALRPRSNLFGMMVDFFKIGNPKLIHVIMRITPRVVFYTRLIKLRAPRAKFVFSALQPPCVGQRFCVPPLFYADGVICTSQTTRALFRDRVQTTVIPNGVDTKKFKPADETQRQILRRKYDLLNDKPLILHVGQITEGRNLNVLPDIARATNSQTLIIGGQSITSDRRPLKRLLDAGVKVITEYIPNIEELYQVADVYLFPTMDPSFAVEMPLSVLEAAACNLPIVTTDFSGLREHLGIHHGIVIANSPEKMVSGILKHFSGNRISTRELVEGYSWPQVAEKVMAFYEKLNDKDKLKDVEI